MAHPPRSKPPLRSSSGPPNPCITPSTETLVVVINLMSWSPPHVRSRGAHEARIASRRRGVLSETTRLDQVSESLQEPKHHAAEFSRAVQIMSRPPNNC